MRGAKSKVGDTRTSPNGYHYTRTADRGWQLTHRLVAEENLGRTLKENERVRFDDKDRTNLTPSNIIVYVARETTKAKKIAQLRSKIDDLQGQLELLLEED